MNAIRRTFCAAALTALCSLASAQPQKPLHLILPVSAGSGVDAIVRSTTNALAKAAGQPVIVENQPGAGGITGTLAIVKAPADGSTIGVVSNNHVTNPAVYKTLPFDSVADITPIAVLGSTPFVLVVNPHKLPAANLDGLLALLKAKPGVYNYASGGNGTILHFAGAMFADQAGVDIRHIPYKGVGPMITDLLGGQVDLAVTSLPSVQGHLKTGALRAIGVCGRERTPAAPDIPTLAEQGLPGYEAAGWFAAIGPAKLPAAEVKRLHDAWVATFADPEVKAAMARQGNDIRVTSPEEAARFFRAEVDKYQALSKKIGMQID
ncbi:MAG TPA: tripartite tricarboxylate transporter substrate binding protein [Usitatibacter sp.]|nr:tripartite tricarboxylate transporter substrate binding protein [Usitatibacter sp.]